MPVTQELTNSNCKGANALLTPVVHVAGFGAGFSASCTTTQSARTSFVDSEKQLLP